MSDDDNQSYQGKLLIGNYNLIYKEPQENNVVSESCDKNISHSYTNNYCCVLTHGVPI